MQPARQGGGLKSFDEDDVDRIALIYTGQSTTFFLHDDWLEPSPLVLVYY